MPRPEWSFFMLAEDHIQLKWLTSWVKARFTPWGHIIFPLFIVGLLISSVGTQIAAYFFVSLVASLFLTSLLLSLFFKPTVTAARSLPPYPAAGETYVYRVTLTNTGRRPLRNLELFVHQLPYGLYDVSELRQPKNFIPWLKPGEQVVFSVAMQARRRGSYVLKPLLAGSSFPTGLARSLCRVASQSRFYVFPKPVTLPPLDLPVLYQPGVEGHGLVSRVQGNQEFLSTREHRDGDRLRDIHWNSSARAGTLIVKEYAHERSIRLGLIVDVELARFEKHRYFEARIALCAAMAEDLLKKNFALDLLVNDGVSSAIQTRGGVQQFTGILEKLCDIEGQPRVYWPQLLQEAQRLERGNAGYILFLKTWDNARQQAADTLKRSGAPVRIIVISDHPLPHPQGGHAVSVYSPGQLGFSL